MPISIAPNHPAMVLHCSQQLQWHWPMPSSQTAQHAIVRDDGRRWGQGKEVPDGRRDQSLGKQPGDCGIWFATISISKKFVAFWRQVVWLTRLYIADYTERCCWRSVSQEMWYSRDVRHEDLAGRKRARCYASMCLVASQAGKVEMWQNLHRACARKRFGSQNR